MPTRWLSSGPSCSTVHCTRTTSRAIRRPSSNREGSPTLLFQQVREPKSAKNRIHWDVVAPDVYALVAAGARILREPDDDIVWHVLADPEGNEFCAFSDE